MTLQTWIAEFVDNKVPSDLEEALQLTIRKWRGVLPTSLRKHGMSMKPGGAAVTDGKQSFHLLGECATCRFMRKITAKGSPCPKCYSILKHNGCTGLAEYISAWHGEPQALLKKLRSRLRSIACR